VLSAYNSVYNDSESERIDRGELNPMFLLLMLIDHPVGYKIADCGAEKIIGRPIKILIDPGNYSKNGRRGVTSGLSL
jgi:hypothetical protein